MNEENPSRPMQARLAPSSPAHACQGLPGARMDSSPRAVQSLSVAFRSYECLASMEGAVDNVHLLLASQPNEVNRVSRYSNRQVRVLFRMIHRVEQRLAI